MKTLYILKQENNEKHRTANSTLAIGGVSSPLDNFVVAESLVQRINFCVKIRSSQSGEKLVTRNFKTT